MVWMTRKQQQRLRRLGTLQKEPQTTDLSTNKREGEHMTIHPLPTEERNELEAVA